VLNGDPATSSPKGGGAEPPPQFLDHVYCGQTPAWIKIPLGMEVSLVLDEDPAPPPQKGAQPPIFGSCLLWPNGCIDQNATWYGGTPRHRSHCARWVPLQEGGTVPQFSAHICYGQTAGWIKMPLGTMAGLGPGNIVLDADPAPPPPRGTASPKFRPMSVVAKQLDGSRCHLVRR